MTRIRIRYIEKKKHGGGEHVIERQLINGRLCLMGHEMKITPKTTNAQLSKFNGVKVLSWNIIKPRKK